MNSITTMTPLFVPNGNREYNKSSQLHRTSKNNSRDYKFIGDSSNMYGDNSDIVSYETLYYILMVNMWGGGLPITIFGVVTNILNIHTFLKQGIKDTVNISLLGLATSDLGSQIALSLADIFTTPGFNTLDVPFAGDDLMYPLVWFHVMFTRVTTLITAYITLERCICVAAPLKVKNIFSPTRTIVCIIVIYAVMLASVIPMLYTVRLSWVLNPLRNTTVLGVTFIDDRNQVENITFVSSNLLPTAAFFLVIVCTVLLVVNLQKKSQWRMQASASSSISITSRDRKVVKMVTLISVIFLTCYLPGTAAFIWMILDTEMRFDGKHRNQLYAVFSILFNLESINASINLFIYLRLSSKFRTTFMNAFCLHKKAIENS